MGDVCTDGRFDLIERFKRDLVEATNIETSPEEMAVLDSILFRMWQMGWLDRLEQPPASPWHRVDEELPVKGEIVIVSDGKRTWDVGQYHCLVSSDDRTKWWWKGHTIKTVKWWMRKKDAIPEPPKEDA